MRDADWNRLIRLDAEATVPLYSGGLLVSTEIIDEVDAELERGVETEPEAELSTGVLNSLSATHGRIVRR
tara:strand:- start:27 stop:236 length:210 start_codon:yes stop_codon:yes gene_type:complete